MTTNLRVKRADRIVTLHELRGYFDAFAKPVSLHRVGIEWELFGVLPETGRALPYSGSQGIEAVLASLAEKFHYEILEEDGRIIALFRGDNYVALEPGGQLELSAEPVGTIHEVQAQLLSFRNELREISRTIPCAWLAVGFHPFSTAGEIEWVPKKRYDIMKNYLAKRGRCAHDMMKRTAANQVSVDFSDEKDAMEKLRVVYGLTSIISSLFSHSPIAEGKYDGFLTRRMASWRETDPDRTGLVSSFLAEGGSFGDYLGYVLDAPMMFIIRDSSWIPMEGQRFKDFVTDGWNGFRATRDDFELHLSTLFPEARLKNCIEIRGADGQPFDLIPSVAALWKGILYDKDSREAAWRLVRNFTWDERCAFHREIERKGPRAFLGRYRGWDLVKELYDLACRGLQIQSRRDAAGRDERCYLEVLYEKVIKPEQTAAEILKEKFERDFRNDPRSLVKYLSF